MNLRVLPEATEDARQQSEYYDDLNPGLGDEFLDALRSAYDAILANPKLFAMHERASPRRQFRFAMLEGFPFQVVYLVRRTETVVFAVAHNSRNPDYWIRRKS